MFQVECSRLRFLVVDDNSHMRRIIRALLHGYGVREAFEAEDGAAGVEAFAAYSPDIVLLDWEMPILNGIELTRMLRQPDMSPNPYVPIILVTAHADKRHVEEARDAGVTEILAKPISAKGLYQRIVSVVAMPRPFIKTATYFGPDRRRLQHAVYAGPERRGRGEAERIAVKPLVRVDQS